MITDKDWSRKCSSRCNDCIDPCVSCNSINKICEQCSYGYTPVHERITRAIKNGKELNTSGCEYSKFISIRKEENRMIRACEARKQAEGRISKDTEIQLKEAENSITKAVNEGKCSTYCYKYLGVQAVKELERLGYKVINSSDQREGTMFKISW